VKILNRGLALAVVGAGLAALPTIGVQAAPAAQADPDGVAVTKIRDAASGAVALRRHPATDKVGFVRADGANGDLLPSVAADGRQGAVDKAEAYLDRFSGAFGARAGELAQTEVYADKSGWSVTFQQSYRGVPVFAGEVKAHVDREGDLTSVNGFAAPALSLDVTPRLSEAQASEKALAAVRAKPAGYEDGGPAGYRDGLTVRKAELTIYRTGSTRGIDGEARLAWAVEVWNKATIRESLILDAATGKPLNRWSMMAHALERHVYEAQQKAPYGYDHVWSEGQAFPATMTEDQKNEALGASETYWLFRNTFGYNSWDGNSGPMYTINNDPRISCPNANWNGFSTNYCTGVTGDDTVAHEWGHAYTESTSGLIYQWQSGAMNEAYSDIWGETVDMLNERQNEGGETPDAPKYRTPGLCSDYTRSEITMEITSPASVAGPCTAAPASFGPVFGQTPVTASVVVGDDAATGTAPDGTPDTSATNGCQTFINKTEITGNWVYVDRGTCTFAVKAANAETAGAKGIVVGDSVAGRAPISMSGSAKIYGVMVTQADGAKFKAADPSPVAIEIAAVPADTDETYRWLSGESDPAFGGAIRDMWNPNCYGDPGRVSDAEYHCTSDDAGGVHSNSGVVNRTFALLVDGMDGQGTGIGLDKAAWLFWHTQSNYLTPASYFPDLADGLEASCEVLQDRRLEVVTLGDPKLADGSDGGVVDPETFDGLEDADCDMLADVIAETELRTDPTEQCDWQPLLAKEGAPVLDCGEGKAVTTLFSEDFEDGLAGWTQDEELGYPTSTGRPWVASTDAPDHTGGVAFGPDPVEGDCDPQSDDITSRNGLISPAITVPAAGTPRFSFDHYVATEATWDGGNVKVSVDGGDFDVVPVDAYLFNAPGGELDSRQGPMGGEPAWTGTDGGQLKGSWGTSIIDLGAVAPEGASVKFRFDMGRDGCNGIDGWYVDNVKVEVCADSATTPPTTPPAPTPTPTPTPEPIADSTTTGKVSPKRPRFGHDFTVIGKVQTENRALRGRVIFRIDGKRIGSRKVREGRVVMTVRKNYGVGKHTLVVVYRGTDQVARSKDKLRFRVRR
jgi:Zn-dependent metalloprotease